MAQNIHNMAKMTRRDYGWSKERKCDGYRTEQARGHRESQGMPPQQCFFYITSNIVSTGNSYAPNMETMPRWAWFPCSASVFPNVHQMNIKNMTCVTFF